MAIARGIALVLALALPLILVRWLNPEQLGLYRQAFQIVTTMVSLLCLQVSASAYYFTPREPERKAQIALHVLLFYLVVGGAFALVLAVYPQIVMFTFKGDELVGLIPMVGIVTLLWLVSLNLESVVIANGDIRWASAVTVLIQLLKTSLLIAAAMIGGTARAVVIAALVIGVVHFSICLVYLKQRFGHFWSKFDWPLFKMQLANALPFGIGGIAYIVQFDFHNFYVSKHFTPAEFAVYSIGCFQLPLLQILIDAAVTSLLPQISRLEKDGSFQGIWQVWAGSVRFLAFFFFPICAMFFVLRREFIVTLFTERYASATPIFAVNLFNLLLYIFLVGTLLRAFPEFKFFRIKFCLVLLPVTWLALYVGVGANGLVGAIWAVALTRLLDIGVTMFVIGRKLGVTWRDMKLFYALGQLALVALLAALVTESVKTMMISLPVQLVLGICSLIYGATYLAGLFVSGAITREELSMFRSLWPKFSELQTWVSSVTEAH
ncbi:MAG: oligosaccharide flippase family protein [Acidobacteriota bacterium]|nr:oligosaccharide flippase family protein [Acidobacteriota bacterium]